MDEQQIQSRLWQAATSRAAATGRQFGEGAYHDLQAMIARAASYLAAIGNAPRPAAELKQA